MMKRNAKPALCSNIPSMWHTQPFNPSRIMSQPSYESSRRGQSNYGGEIPLSGLAQDPASQLAISGRHDMWAISSRAAIRISSKAFLVSWAFAVELLLIELPRHVLRWWSFQGGDRATLT